MGWLPSPDRAALRMRSAKAIHARPRYESDFRCRSMCSSCGFRWEVPVWWPSPRWLCMLRPCVAADHFTGRGGQVVPGIVTGAVLVAAFRPFSVEGRVQVVVVVLVATCFEVLRRKLKALLFSLCVDRQLCSTPSWMRFSELWTRRRNLTGCT